MKSFQNLNPGLKLTAGFGLCLALAALVGGMALTRMAVIAHTAEAMRSETVIGLKSLSAFHTNARRLRTLEMEHALAPPSDQPNLESDMTVAITAARSGLQEYIQSVHDPVDDQNAQKLETLWTQYLVMHHKEVSVTHNQNSQYTYRVLSGPMRTQFLRVRDLCDTMMNWNDVRSRWYGRQIQSVYTQSQGWVIGLLFLSVVVGAGIARLITRHMTQTLSNLENEITDRERAEAQSKASERRFRALITHSSDVFAILDATGIRRYVSPASENIWGYPPEMVIGTHTLANVHPEDHARARAVLEQVLTLPTDQNGIVTELRLRHRDGSWKPAEILVHNRLDDPDVCGLILTCRDVTARRHYEEQLRHQAFHDQLTGLPNRDLLLDRLDHALARSERRDTHAAVVFVDLDNFKVINDSLGHGAGDILLLTVAERMKACVRAEDTVARFGGDEFAILLEAVDTDEAVLTAERIIAALRPALQIGGRDIFITASLGVATSSGGDASSLLRDADVAMYQAKTHGKAGFAVFDRSMSDHATERLELEGDLRRAIDEGQLRLHYQPIVSLETGRMTEVEALVRWHHPERGLIPPLKFIPIAEETGLIVPLGHWVLEEACRQACEWQSNSPDAPPLIIGVNLSTRQFRQEDLLEDVASVLERTGLPPSCLKLEITESLMATDTDATIAKLYCLKDLGVHLAVDDFGTGYSSMSYLANFPVDTLKIDRSFVQRIGEGSEAEAILQAILSLAKALSLRVTSEGIETDEQRLLLQALGCDRGQGYLFSRPVTGDALAALLAAEQETLPQETNLLAA